MFRLEVRQILWFSITLLCFETGLSGIMWWMAWAEVQPFGFGSTSSAALAVVSGGLLAAVATALYRLRRQEERFEKALVEIGDLSIQRETHEDHSLRTFDAYAAACNEIIANALEVSRAGIWLLADDGQELIARDVFKRASGDHDVGAVLRRSEYPIYFAALSTSWVVAANRAETDPLTSEFRDGYLRPLNIKAMMDSMLYSGERLVGVVCLEQEGRCRSWSSAEKRFAGSASRLVSLALEIDARRAAEKKVQTALKEAIRTNDAKTSFLLNLSHEVRTPLNAVIGFSQIGALRAKESEISSKEEIISCFEQSQASGEHLLRLFEDMLDIGRIEMGLINVDLACLDVGELVSEVVQTVSTQSAQKDIEVKAEQGPMIGVLADRKLLTQVMINLVVNSIKYSAENTEIVISARECPQAGQCEISIKDRGFGMSADEVERALQRFERVENPNLASAGGLGVGLPLAKQMIELQGGTFNIRSTKGEGTSVILTLPLAMPLTHKAIA